MEIRILHMTRKKHVFVSFLTGFDVYFSILVTFLTRCYFLGGRGLFFLLLSVISFSDEYSFSLFPLSPFLVFMNKWSRFINFSCIFFSRFSNSLQFLAKSRRKLNLLLAYWHHFLPWIWMAERSITKGLENLKVGLVNRLIRNDLILMIE